MTSKFMYDRNDRYLITPADAEKLLSFHYDKNREEDFDRVRQLIALFKSGGVIIQPVIVVYVRSLKTFYVVDGQHRLRAIVNGGITCELNIQINEFDTIDDMFQAFRFIDHNLVRKHVLAIPPEERDGIDETVINSIIGAGFAIESGYDITKWPKGPQLDLRRDVFLRYREAGLAFFKAIKGAHHRSKMLVRPLIAVALPTLADPETRAAAIGFWESVANGGRGVGVAELLCGYINKGHIWRGNKVKNITMREIASYWNAHYLSIGKKAAHTRMLKDGGMAFVLDGVKDEYYCTIKERLEIKAGARTAASPKVVPLIKKEK